MAWTQHKLADILKTGDICYVKILSLGANGAAHVSLEQDSGAQGALLAIDNATGEIKAMVGGRDFNESKFDRATQALRQVGSSFKPYVYTTVIDGGASPDDTILDEPISFENAIRSLHSAQLRRQVRGHHHPAPRAGAVAQYPGTQAREQSRHQERHRLRADASALPPKLPPYLPVALGSAEITLMEQTSAYSVFPNDGVRVIPRYITRVTDYEGRVLEEDFPDVKDVISERTARIMTSMLREVVLHGTGIAAAKLPSPSQARPAPPTISPTPGSWDSLPP